MDTRSPIARARGLGSAKEGVQQWWAQRLTAIALVPLSIWFVAGMVALAGASHDQAAAWLAHPVNGTLMILTLGFVFHHGQLGLQVVIEDYLHAEGRKLALLIAVKLLALLLALAGSLAVLRLMLGGAG
ncbi:MAG: succinate dehydrogenase, hydrophobic membrane anchor protein [Rhodospirillales bacterium]|nr:succinate dehydrogenase, hydrophobic membrane anchor protein [Rhodospirillales bacterium]